MNLKDLDLPYDLEIVKSNSTQNKLGYFLYDPSTKKILDSFNSTEAFIPASTCKILSAVFALKVLGADYRFKTYLSYTGTIKNEILEGNLYLKGTGDPTLSISHLIDFASKMVNQGVRELRGKFYFDESHSIPSTCIQSPREPWANYNCGISALSLDFNQARLKWDRKTEQEEYYFIPDSLTDKVIRLENELPLETNILYQPKDNLWLLSAAEPAMGEKKVPIKKPAEYTANFFRKICGLYGIKLSTPLTGEMPEQASIFHVHESNTLVNLVESMLEYSNNFMAEQIQIAASRQLLNRSIGIEEAAKIMQEWFLQQIPLTNWNSINLKNGSGLNAGNRITPEQLASILEFADSQNYSNRCFQSLLPAAGWQGSLVQRFTEPEVAFRIWAKPGAMNYVYAYAGYLFKPGGKKLIYSILINNFARRAAVDVVSEPLPNEVIEHAQLWTKSALDLVEGIQRAWVTGS